MKPLFISLLLILNLQEFVDPIFKKQPEMM